jgi:hypothetical protein
MTDTWTMLRAIRKAISKAAGGHGAAMTATTVLDPLTVLVAEILAQGPEIMRDQFIQRLDEAIALTQTATREQLFMQRRGPVLRTEPD